MFDVLILAQSVIDEGFCDSTECWTGYGITGVFIIGLVLLVGRVRRRSEGAYWDRRRREAELRAADPDMAKPDEDVEY